MGKDILFIGVGGAGRRVIEKLNEQNIPNSQCLSFGWLTQDGADDFSNPPHYDWLSLNDIDGGCSAGTPVKEMLTEKAVSKIKNIIKESLNL